MAWCFQCDSIFRKSCAHSIWKIDDIKLLGNSNTIYEDAEDGTIRGWKVYDDDPTGAEISNIFDEVRQSQVIRLSGSGKSNGYRLRNVDGWCVNILNLPISTNPTLCSITSMMPTGPPLASISPPIWCVCDSVVRVPATESQKYKMVYAITWKRFMSDSGDKRRLGFYG